MIVLLIKRYYWKVFRRTTESEEKQRLKQKEINITESQAKALNDEGKLTIVNAIKVLIGRGSVLQERQRLGLNEKRVRILDVVFFIVLLAQYALFLVLLFRVSPHLPSQTSFLNRFGVVYTVEYLNLQIGANIFALITALHFAKSEKETFLSKALLIIIGIGTFPVGLFSIIIGLMFSDDLKDSRGDILKKARLSMDGSWTVLQKRIGFFVLFFMTAFFFGASLMRTTEVIRDFHFIDFVKIDEDNAGVSFTGSFHLQAIDDSTTKVNNPSLSPKVHVYYFDNPDIVYFNYRMKETWVFDEEPEYRGSLFYYVIQEPFEVNQSLDKLVDEFELEFVFIEIPNLVTPDDREIVKSYKISEEHILTSTYEYDVRNKWTWE